MKPEVFLVCPAWLMVQFMPYASVIPTWNALSWTVIRTDLIESLVEERSFPLQKPSATWIHSPSRAVDTIPQYLWESSTEYKYCLVCDIWFCKLQTFNLTYHSLRVSCHCTLHHISQTLPPVPTVNVALILTSNCLRPPRARRGHVKPFKVTASCPAALTAAGSSLDGEGEG